MHELTFLQDTRRANQPPAQPGTTLFTLGLWIRLGFTGVSAVVVALVSVVEVQTHVGAALMLALGGGLLATVAGLRLRSAMREAEPPARRVRSRALHPAATCGRARTTLRLPDP